MAGNVQADNSGNILVEFDYNNIIVVDPNKTIDAFGKIQERLVDHENLVMYANLEAELVPRTKLAVGGSPEDRVRIISVAKINFLKPTKGNFLDTGYYDELTGEGTLQGKGQNQMRQRGATPPEGGKGYIINEPADLNNVIDNGLLGMTQINITTNTSFVPSVKIELEDVQGRALFQLGNNSPYAAFFNLPYPPFYLTLKGYYGQAIRYQLNLEKFNARFNSFSGNYQVSLEFRGYKFNILNEIAMGHLLAVPHMYGARFDVATSPVQAQQSPATALSPANNNIIQNQGLATSNSQGVTQIVTKKGYQKIKEVYSEYKAKNLIPPDFPELTLVQLMTKLDNLEKNIVNSFSKAEVEPLTNIRTYKEFLKQYFDQMRGANNSWFNRFLNPKPILLKTNERVYVFKPDLDKSARIEAYSELEKIVVEFTKVLAANATLGAKGPSPIPNPIKVKTIEIKAPTQSEIDWVATTRIQTGIVNPTKEQQETIIGQYKSSLQPEISQSPENQLVLEPAKFFTFEATGRFDKQIASIEAQANKKLSEYEAKISDKLLEKLSDSATGIGFKPNVRSIMAVIMASAEAFIRLMDEVHTNAWAVKYDPVRKNAILENPGSAPGSDTRDNVKVTIQALESNTGLAYSQIPVYPWPQFFVETPEDKKGRFQLKYIADPTVVDITQGYLYDKWPEVEFVEEYMVGITQKFDPPAEPPPLDNERYTNTLNLNAIEFPNLGLAYANKEEIKFFYEIWERQFLTSRYSNLIRANRNQIDPLIRKNVEIEVENIVSQVNISAPYLALKLKNFDLNSDNYVGFLKNISNMGTGRAYQDFIRDFFVTPYIRNLTENSFGLLNITELGKIPQTSAKSDALRGLLTNAPNQALIIDTLPFTDSTWVTQNMADGKANAGPAVYNTTKSLTIFEPRQIISNFNDVFDFDFNRPVTNFSYEIVKNLPSPYSNAVLLTQNQQPLGELYMNRDLKQLVPTEGVCFYNSPSNLLPVEKQTSMLNTPYMINAILNGVDNQRRSDPYPYVQAAYLFLNSLPLATLKEKYKKLNGTNTEDLDYIASCFKKFGAIHKLPYSWILKLGSNWHRYKKFKTTGIDIIDKVWTDFNYIGNYSPIQSAVTQNYKFVYKQRDAGVLKDQTFDIVLQSQTSGKIGMTVGFYPKVINDFNYFYKGYDLYVGYTNDEIQSSINNGMKVFNYKNADINGTQNNTPINLSNISVILPQAVVDGGDGCNTDNNTFGIEYLICPSFGGEVNQTLFECFTGITTTVDAVVPITSNPSVFNGSVRTLWSATNFGYFDNGQIAKPFPESYINYIDPDKSEQYPMALLTGLTGNLYSKMDEIFSVFDKRILDLFEDEFLKFSKASTDADSEPKSAQFLESTVNLSANFRNFQALFTSLMTVPAQTSSENDIVYFQGIIKKQYDNFNNVITGFLEYDVLFKYGNPSNYKRRILDSYLSYLSTPVVEDPIQFEPYVQNSLPRRGGNITLLQSRTNNALAWQALETEVGFSTIPNVEYSSNGSYITDFFIDNNIRFNQQNVVLLAPIIKMWATQKLNSPSLTPAQFKNQISLFLLDETNLQDYFLDSVLTGVRAKLPAFQQLPEATIKSAIQGEQSKVENYEIFKALNDKWIAGGDFTTKTLFEDIMFLDRASRNIGETILIDIFALRDMFNQNSLNQAMSVFTFMSGILIKNNFTVMNLPAYVNFYNVQDVDGTTIPQPEGSLQFANSMWGTFLDVDYRNSGPRMICFYVGRPSAYLDLPKGNFRFRDDGFEMVRASENPLIENQKDKKDWALSNRCVGFNVDIGTRNQNIFYSFSVSQDAGVATSEAINTQINMVDQATGRNTATQNVGLYNLYKNRSYKCSVVSLGNALLQPTMYFNLRHVPMFNGPYMITEVQHAIQPGNFQTTFNGIRQGIYDLPSIDNFLQSINQNLLTKLEEILKIEKDKTTVDTTTNSKKASEVVQKSDNKVDASNSCVNNVDTQAYPDYTVTTANKTQLKPKEFADLIKAQVSDENLRSIIYTICYVQTFVENGGNGLGDFVGFNNNFANISLYYNFKPTSELFTKNFCCISVKATSSVTRSEPMVSFKDVKTFISFMESRLKDNLNRIIDMGISKYYVCYWPKTNVSESYYNQNKETEFKTVRETVLKGLDSAAKTGLIPQSKSNELKGQTKNDQNKVTPTPGLTPTPTPVNALPGQTCPPPFIESFAPMMGNTGTIVQVNGKNLENVTGVLVNNTRVLPTGITIFNSSTLRIVVPQVGTGTVKTTGNIVLESQFGNSVQLQPYVFTYDPSIPAAAASSPGSYQNNQASPVPTPSSYIAPVPPNVNTNPLPNPLTVVTQTKSPLGGDEQLVVKVSTEPGVGNWKIDTVPELFYTFYTITTGPDNKRVEDRKSGGVTKILNFVSQDQQTFTLTRQGLINDEFKDDIEFYKDNDVKIVTSPQLYVRPVNQTKDDYIGTFNFEIFVPRSQAEQGFGSINFIRDSSSPDIPTYNGKDYYCINKQSGGGYLIFRFNCPVCDVDGFDVISADNVNQVQSITTVGPNPSTRYQNLIGVNSRGTFRLRIKYRNVGSTTQFTAVSTPFTL